MRDYSKSVKAWNKKNSTSSFELFLNNIPGWILDGALVVGLIATLAVWSLGSLMNS